MSEYRIIDISGWNTDITYNTLSFHGIKAGIFRITEKNNKIDSMFNEHYNGFRSANIPVIGVYKYSYAMSIDEMRTEAQSVVEVLKDYPDFNGVVYLDLEYSPQSVLSKSFLTEMINEFKDIILSHGYRFGFYMNKNWATNIINMEAFRNDDFWIAAYPSEDDGLIVERLRPDVQGQVGWQYTSAFLINGAKYDMSVFDKSYIDSILGDSANTQTKIDLVNTNVSAQTILNIMRNWVGKNEYDGTHKEIVDIYNAYTPRARGYKVTYSDSWCDATVSAAFIKANAVDLLGGTECGVEQHVMIFSAKGIWIEDGTITPQPGDIIVFNWDENSQPNNGFSDHIGIVEYVSDGFIHTIEGNSSNAVSRRQYSIGHGNIRGFARPEYGPETAQDEFISSVPVSDTHPVMSYGASGEYVLLMQNKLAQMGYKITRDGIWGEETSQVLAQFQKDVGLTVDSVCGIDTWDKIEELSDLSLDPIATVIDDNSGVTEQAEEDEEDEFPKEMITTKKAAFRTGPAKKYNMIAKLPAGFDVKVIKQKINKYGNLWYKVEFDDMTGWIYSGSLK